MTTPTNDKEPELDIIETIAKCIRIGVGNTDGAKYAEEENLITRAEHMLIQRFLLPSNQFTDVAYYSFAPEYHQYAAGKITYEACKQKIQLREKGYIESPDKLPRELFDLFACDPLKPPSETPLKQFTDGDYVYSTDGYTMIRAHCNNVNLNAGDLLNKKASVQTEGCFREIVKIPFKLNHAAFAGGKTKPEKRLVRDEVPCSECDGSGEVEWAYESTKNRSYTTSSECPICKGDGIESAKQYELTGRKTFEDAHLRLVIQDANTQKIAVFDPKLFDRLVTVMDHFKTNEPVITYYDKFSSVNAHFCQEGLCFLVAGKFQVLIMPLLITNLDGVEQYTTEIELKTNGEGFLRTENSTEEGLKKGSLIEYYNADGQLKKIST